MKKYIFIASICILKIILNKISGFSAFIPFGFILIYITQSKKENIKKINSKTVILLLILYISFLYLLFNIQFSGRSMLIVIVLFLELAFDEEILFRYYLLNDHNANYTDIIYSSALFAIMHLNIYFNGLSYETSTVMKDIIQYFIFGICISIAYLSTNKSIFKVTFFHFFYNMINMLFNNFMSLYRLLFIFYLLFKNRKVIHIKINKWKEV